MGKVAAIQMTSGHIVADNLAVAGKLLREAKETGADIACLPENFSFIGLKDADKLQVAEPYGEGEVQDFLVNTARQLKMWILGGTTVIHFIGVTPMAAPRLGVPTQFAANHQVAVGDLVFAEVERAAVAL